MKRKWKWKSAKELHSPKEIFDFYKVDLDSYFGLKFEDLIKELFISSDITTKNKYNLFGRVWGKIPLKYITDKDKSSFEIDVVGINSITKKEILFCEVKWQDAVNAENVAKDLIQKAKYVKWGTNNRVEEYIIIAKSFSKKIDKIEDINITCLDIKDISIF